MDKPYVDGRATSPAWQRHENGIVVWPIGAFEQHGHHLPLMTDVLLAEHFGRHLAAGLGAALLPALPFGTSLEHTGFRGTMTLSPELLMALVRHVAAELEAQHFRRLVLVSGHGGNFSLYPVVRDLNRQDRPLKLIVAGVAEAAAKVGGVCAGELHSGRFETSIMLALHPDLVGPDRRDCQPGLAAEPWEQADLNLVGFGHMSPAGGWGRASEGNAAEGRKLLAEMEAALLAWTRERLRRFDADPRYAGPGPVVLRPLRPDDLALGLRLKTAANWNQTADDWRFMLGTGGPGNLVAMHGGVAAGTVTALDYAGRFTWVGMLLVDPDYRRRGLGTALLNGAIAVARGPVRLDATPAGKQLYDTMGFVDECRLARWECAAVRPPPASADAASGDADGVTVRPATKADLAALAAWDAPSFGADRRAVLAYLLATAPEYAFVADRRAAPAKRGGGAKAAPNAKAPRRGGTLAGFLLGRHGSRAEQLGPLVAADDATARALLAAGLAAAAGRPVYLDVPDAQRTLGAALTALGFSVQRPFIRMSRGATASFGDPARQYAIAGPELG